MKANPSPAQAMLNEKKKNCKYKEKENEMGDNDSVSTCDDTKINDLQIRSKLKVELCRNFLENKICPYRQRCKFAHGLQELLKNTELGINYRTKKCKVFFEQKWCRFGERCNFKHSNAQEGFKKFTRSNKVLHNFPQIFLDIKHSSSLPRIQASAQISHH